MLIRRNLIKVSGTTILNLRFEPLLTLSQTTNYRKFQTESVRNDNRKFDKNGGQFSVRVENAVGKGEIARYEQFLLIPQYFQKTRTADL